MATAYPAALDDFSNPAAGYALTGTAAVGATTAAAINWKEVV